MKKVTNKGVLTLVGGCLLTAYVLLKPSQETISIDGKELFKKLDQVEVTYDLEIFHESLYSYEDFLKDGFMDYQCTAKQVEFNIDNFYDLDDEEIALKVLNHKLTKDSGKYIPFDKKNIALVEDAIQNASLTCPIEKKEMFCHNLSELTIVECKGEAGIQGQYFKEDKRIVLYSTEIEKCASYLYPQQYEYSYQELLDQTITNTLEHELNHMIQDSCSCYQDTKTCFNNKTLWEGLAEEDTTFPNTYVEEREALHLLSYTFLFDEDYEPYQLKDLLYNNDLKRLFELFDADTEAKQKEVYNMLQALNLSHLLGEEENVRDLQNDFRTTLTKQFCKNLITYNEKNNLPLEEVIYFYKSFLQQCLKDQFYSYGNSCITKFSIEYIHDMIEIQEAFITYCVNYYGIDDETIVQKLQNIEQVENKENPSNQIILPYATYETLSTGKQSFLKDMNDLSRQKDFHKATKFIIETTEQVENHTFKKKR